MDEETLGICKKEILVDVGDGSGFPDSSLGPNIGRAVPTTAILNVYGSYSGPQIPVIVRRMTTLLVRSSTLTILVLSIALIVAMTALLGTVDLLGNTTIQVLCVADGSVLGYEPRGNYDNHPHRYLKEKLLGRYRGFQ